MGIEQVQIGHLVVPGDSQQFLEGNFSSGFNRAGGQRHPLFIGMALGEAGRIDEAVSVLSDAIEDPEAPEDQQFMAHANRATFLAQGWA